MAATKSKIGIYSMAGILAAVLIIASFFASGVQIPGLSQDINQNTNPQARGTLVVSVIDAPADIEKLELTISAIYLQSPSEDSESEWILLPFISGEPEVTFDLLQLTNGLSLDVVQTELNVGTYHKIRLEITGALATYVDEDPTDGTPPMQKELKVPPGHIDIITELNIQADTITNLVIDIQPDDIAINKNDIFRPIIKPTVTTTTEPDAEAAQITTTTPTLEPTESPTPTPTPSPTEEPNPTPTETPTTSTTP